jgi:hypothetical protein
MSVAPEVTREILKEELETMASLASTYGWEVTLNLEALTVQVKLKSVIDSELYVLEAQCNDYKELPPLFEFIHPETGERGIRSAYPNGGSFFHEHPCICVEWNRKATLNGPHPEWKLADWQRKRPTMTYLGDMFLLVQQEINRRSQYTGRKR